MRPRISIRGSVCPSVRRSVRPSVRPSVGPSVRPSVRNAYSYRVVSEHLLPCIWPCFSICYVIQPDKKQQIKTKTIATQMTM